jgi:Nucleotidyl transferase AbiEii toxin, Type IV TA system
MDTAARLSAEERAVLFNEAGAARGFANAIVEKDFWVCWTLKRLFSLPETDVLALVFKGGTSLSKAYGAIRRFSEDIDISFDRTALGYKNERDPGNASNRQASALLENLAADVRKYIATVLLPNLEGAITVELGTPGNAKWRLSIDPDDPQSLIFQYPPCHETGDYAALDYIRPRVKLECGARGDPWPKEKRSIRPYAAEEFPEAFLAAIVEVDVLALRRSFWEKATLLHAEYHRAPDSPTPKYISRHYYDVAMLADHKDGPAAISDVDLLRAVAEHKSVFFRSAWAHYETARPGTLHLRPNSDRIADLRADYRDMQPMMFDYPAPTFEDIMKRLESLEHLINGNAKD